MNDIPLGWAIAGTGSIARRFAADMRLARHGRVVAVASATPERAAGLAASIGPDITAGDLDAVLRDRRVGAVYVAGRNEHHREQALRCLVAGKPVLVEKPLAATENDAERIREAAADAGLLAMEAMWMRFTPGMRRLKALVDGGAVGAIRALDASLSFRNAAPKASPVLDLGVYPISLAVQLLGPPKEVAALATENGTDASFALSWGQAVASFRCGFAAEGANALAITGDAGILATDTPFFCPSMLTLRRVSRSDGDSASDGGSADRPPRLSWLGSAKSLLRPLRARRIPTFHRGTGLQYQADHFAECLAAGLADSPVMPLAESVETIRVAETVEAAIRRSAGFEEGQRLKA